MEIDIDPDVWAIGGKIGWAKNAQLVKITLKDQNFFPCQKEYPLKPEAWRGLKTIIKKPKGTGLIKQM